MFVLLAGSAGASSGRRSSRARLRPHWRRCVVRGSCSATTRNMSYGRRSDSRNSSSLSRPSPFRTWSSPAPRDECPSSYGPRSFAGHPLRLCRADWCSITCAGPCRRGRSSRCDCRMPLDRRPAAAPGSSRRGRVRQTIKQGWQTWAMLASILMVLAAAGQVYSVYVYGGFYGNSAWMLMGAYGVAGALPESAFSGWKTGRTQRFLVHHGCAAGNGLAGEGHNVGSWPRGRHVRRSGCRLVHASPLSPSWRGLDPGTRLFAAGIRGRDHLWNGVSGGITAFVIASVATICLALPLIELALENVVQAAGILIVAAALLMISWAWRRDWMLEAQPPGDGYGSV